jgi:two-component system CitB family sensor kinase
MHFIRKEVPDPIIAGLLLGKMNRAHELKVNFVLDRETTFFDIPSAIDRADLVTIMGNLIDNAMEAALEADREERTVTVFLTDIGKDLIIEVDDTGTGIAPEHEGHIFQMGFTTKHNGKNSGFGLALVNEAVERQHGYITFSQNEWGGTTFIVAIPKREKG